jgi:glycosyltransferase involved in cell wall biosynthesis
VDRQRIAGCGSFVTRVIVMLGTSERTMGGISAVIGAYREAGLFRRWPIVYVATHCDGGALRKLVFAARAYVRFVAVLLREDVRLVHVHSASNASFWRKSAFVALAYALRRPFIIHLHGGGFVRFYERCGTLQRRAVRFSLERAACVVIVADYWRAELRAIAPRAKLSRIYNPLSAGELLAARSRAHERQGVLYLGRMSPEKGVDDLLQAFAAVHSEHPSSWLDICGDGDPERVARCAHALGIADAVRLHGWVTGDRKREVLHGAGIYVLPSYTEGMPMAVLEAMAAGLPVVATPVGGVPEVVRPGLDGYIVPAGDTAGLADVLARLLADGDERKRMGEQGRERVAAEFMPTEVLSQVEALYRDLGWRPLHDVDVIATPR